MSFLVKPLDFTKSFNCETFRGLLGTVTLTFVVLHIVSYGSCGDLDPVSGSGRCFIKLVFN